MRTTRLVARILAAVGLLLVIVAGGLIYSEIAARAEWRTTTGRVVDHAFDKRNYRAIVRFETEDGRAVETRGRVGTSRRTPDLGDTVSVTYDPARPEEARIDTLLDRWFLPGLFAFIGCVVFAVGGGMLAYIRIARGRDEELRHTGLRHSAEVLGVRRNSSMSYNDEAAWRVEARWTDPFTGETKTALSRNLDFDPAPWLSDRIDVYVKRDAGGRALVDLSGIEAAAGR